MTNSCKDEINSRETKKNWISSENQKTAGSDVTFCLKFADSWLLNVFHRKTEKTSDLDVSSFCFNLAVWTVFTFFLPKCS